MLASTDAGALAHVSIPCSNQVHALVFYLDVMFVHQKAYNLEQIPLNIDVDFLHQNPQRHCAVMRGQ